MASIRFSVVVTVLNEESSIDQLIDSLINQTQKPEEIIIVDAGSSDKSAEMVLRRGVTLIQRDGVNRSVGRNIGVEAARSDFIAVTDAGCVADVMWLENLSRGFKNGVDSVAGFYGCSVDSDWQKIFNLYLATQEKDLNQDTFLPSSRSLAFNKSIWKKVGGYPEYLDTCEDLVFAKKLKELGKMGVANKAIVRWKLPGSLGEFFKAVSNYAAGDVSAMYWPHVRKHLLVWIRYILFLLLPCIFVGYLFYPILKFGRKISMRLWGKLILTQLTADIGVMWGGIKSLKFKSLR